jgi:SAM-dependent methyltransferase
MPAWIAPPPAAAAPARFRCVECGTCLGTANGRALVCDFCGRTYAVHDGLVVVQEKLTGKNRIAADFYNSDRWQRFRPWEQLFLQFQGGIRGARLQILRHLRRIRGNSLLEVGIGDGENVRLLSRRLQITGIDIAKRPLEACRERYPDRNLVLALAEGEHIPFEDGSFDGVFCVGGFNFFSDPARALAEMARVTRSGGPVVVADELPNLLKYGWGHLLGIPRFDIWLLERFWLGPEFTTLVLANRLDVQAVAQAALPRARIYKIWHGLGYCIVGAAP